MFFSAELPDGSTRDLLRVSRYDFNWQTTYQLSEPIRLPAGTRVHVKASFDNSAGNPSNPDPTVDSHLGPGIERRDAERPRRLRRGGQRRLRPSGGLDRRFRAVSRSAVEELKRRSDRRQSSNRAAAGSVLRANRLCEAGEK